MYKTGGTIKIRNKVGILTVHIIREMDMRDVARCLGDDRLPNLVKPRLRCLGNAVVPQQFYPFFMAMYLIETGSENAWLSISN